MKLCEHLKCIDSGSMKILFTPLTTSSIAHIIRSFALAERFVENGDEVFFTSCRLKKDFIEKEGYRVVRTYSPFNLNDENDQSVNYLSTHKKEMVEWFKADIDAALEVHADVVIGCSCLFGPHVTYATGIPTVALMNGQYAPTTKGLMGICLCDDSLKSILLRNMLRPVFNREFLKKYLSEVLDAYRIIGIEHGEIKSREEMYSPMPILIPGDEEFEPQLRTDENTKFIGPLFWDGFERIDDGELSEESILKFKGNDKLIFLTFGGSVFNKDIYDRVLRSLNKIDAKKIVALGPNFKREDFQDDSDDLIIRNFVPGLRLSKLSDIIVNTGSQGAIMQALTYGKPVVAFPVGIDQAYFANRLEEMKLGRNVNKTGILGFSKRESYQFVDDRIPEKMILAVNELMNNDEYSKNAQSYSQRLEKRYHDPAGEAVNFVYNRYRKI